MKTSFKASRRGPDYVAEELVSILSARSAFEFKPLFLLVHANLRARNAASGGEDMLRLRAYEKLQGLVLAGAVTKTGKEYKGVAAGLARLAAAAAAAEVNAGLRITNRASAPGLRISAPLQTAKPRIRKKVSKTPRLR